MSKIKKLLIILLVLAASMLLIVLAGKKIGAGISKEQEEKGSAKETSPAIQKDYDLAAFFPNEGTKDGILINECGAFTDYVGTSINDEAWEELYSLIHSEALLDRAGVRIDRARFSEELSLLRERYPDGKLYLRNVELFSEGKSSYRPKAIIHAVYAEPAKSSELSVSFDLGETLYLYVYTDQNNHIDKFFFSAMEEGGFGAVQ